MGHTVSFNSFKKGASVNLHLLYRSLENNYIPRMAKMEIKKIMNETRYPILGKDRSNVATRRFILGTALILLRGLNTRMVLKDFRFGNEGIIDIKLIITTVKSRIFQGSRK
jgi:hypothetical protein